MLERLVQQLPSELVWKILYSAACDFVYVDRNWVVQLALVSRFVYRLVHDVLFHDIVIMKANYHKLSKLAQDDSFGHVFLTARRLVADDVLNRWDGDRTRRLLFRLTSLDAPLALIKTLSLSPDFRPRSLSVRYGWLATCTDSLPAATLASVTHLVGYFPRADEQQEDSIALSPARIDLILAAMPALTHLGFDVSDLHERDLFSEYDEDERQMLAARIDQADSDDYPWEERLDLESLESALRAALMHSRIQAVAMRVAQDWLPQWPAIRLMATQLQDARVLAWRDTRVMRSERTEAKCAALDGWQGRDIWTEARQIWSPATDLEVSRESLVR